MSFKVKLDSWGFKQYFLDKMKILNQIFTIKEVPSVNWSSELPLNMRPKLKTLLMLIVGLFLFGLGEAILISSGLGVSPWTVLAQGLALNLEISIGMATFIVSIVILVLWIPLKQTPGIGTVLNAIIIASAIDLTLPYLPVPEMFLLKLAQACLGIMIVGIGSGIYLISNLGARPTGWFNDWFTKNNQFINSGYKNHHRAHSSDCRLDLGRNCRPRNCVICNRYWTLRRSWINFSKTYFTKFLS